MSGGSWDYLYAKLELASNELLRSKDPLRRAFGEHMCLVAVAMQKIEWVDSCDNSPGDELEAIKVALGLNWKIKTLGELKKDAENIVYQIKELLKEQS